jgi:hypothetical protein
MTIFMNVTRVRFADNATEVKVYSIRLSFLTEDVDSDLFPRDVLHPEDVGVVRGRRRGPASQRLLPRLLEGGEVGRVQGRVTAAVALGAGRLRAEQEEEEEDRGRQEPDHCAAVSGSQGRAY